VTAKKKNALILAGLLLLLALEYLPIIMMVNISFRKSIDIFANFWDFPWPLETGNYANAFRKLFLPALNSMLVSLGSVCGILILATLSGHVFGRLKFMGKNLLFYMVLALMMVPTMLLLAPNYALAVKLGLRDTYWGLWLFYIASGQVFGIFLCTSFFKSLPESLYEAARLDGANELQCIWHISVPLSRPILVTVGIMTFLSFYNDLIWPMLILNDPNKETLMLALMSFNPVDPKQSSRPDIGVQAAGYVFASLPLLAVFWFGMKHYIRGITAGAIKA